MLVNGDTLGLALNLVVYHGHSGEEMARAADPTRARALPNHEQATLTSRRRVRD